MPEVAHQLSNLEQETEPSESWVSQAGTRPSSPSENGHRSDKAESNAAQGLACPPLHHATALKPGSLWTTLASVAFLVYLSLTSLFVGFPVCLVLRMVHSVYDRKQRKLLHRWTARWASHYNYTNPCIHRTTVAGLQNLAMVHSGRPVIFVCNHQSALDIFLLYGINAHFKWVSKSSNFHIPLIGWAMTLNDYVPVKRGSRDSVMRMFAHCRQHLSNGNSVFIFPEGTRNIEGGLKPFKSGAFTLAIDTQTPIIPIVLDGTSDIFSSTAYVGTFNAGGRDLKVTVLAPIEPHEFGSDAEALSGSVREAMDRGLAELQDANQDDQIRTHTR